MGKMGRRKRRRRRRKFCQRKCIEL